MLPKPIDIEERYLQIAGDLAHVSQERDARVEICRIIINASQLTRQANQLTS